MMSLTDFIDTLPNVMPRKSRKLILEGDVLSRKERADIHHRESMFDFVVDVGPDAAAAILAAYRGGRLPVNKGCKPEAAPRAEAYLATSNELRKHIAEKRRRAVAVKDPSVLTEGDLSDHHLLDSVFIANYGPGSGTLTLAGIAVHKRLSGYKTNSGKNTGWRIRFDWVGSDGVARWSEVVPQQADNRRNDPERDWGLHD